jgi:hypothetical protein
MICQSSSSTPLVNGGGRAFGAPASPGALLKSTPATLREQPVYAYIVTTIKTTPDFQLCQTGSGPNFDGGRITLCTCKHKDRATFHPSSDPNDPWKKVWVAGLTSKSGDPSRSLAYLMCVERSFLSQLELWRALPDSCRRAKSASKSELGDLFEPKAAAANDPYNPARYRSPRTGGHVHSTKEHPDTWHHDVMRWGRRSKPHRLLLGQAAQSYWWMHVKMILKLNSTMGVSAHHKMYDSLNTFIADLQEFDP